jgi:mycothiol system anti-sigma-R factor
VAGKAADGPGKDEGPTDVGCDQAVQELYHFLDGELTDDRRAQIVRHLDLCGPCADAAGFEKELRAVIAQRCRDRVPDSLIARVAEAIHRESARSSDGKIRSGDADRAADS